MMKMMYAAKSLEKQIDKGSEFYLIIYENQTVGYTSLIPNYKNKNQLYIDKIYISPETQGRGIGKKVIDEIENKAKVLGLTSIGLNVNRANQAINFYQKVGFEIIETVDNHIGNGYFMNDFVMKKDL